MSFPLKKGFTLIELMIVVGIIGILSAIAFPGYKEWILKNRRLEYLRNMGSFQLEQQRYRNMYGYYAGSAAACNNSTQNTMCWSSSSTYITLSGISVNQETYTAKFTVSEDPDCKVYVMSGGYGSTTMNINGTNVTPGTYDKCYPVQ